MARSAAVLVKGFREFDPDVKIAGVIFNRVGGEGHYRILKDAVRDVPILGWLPVNPVVEIPERHLGLLTAPEMTAAKIREIGEFVDGRIDMGGELSDQSPIRQSPIPIRAGISPQPWLVRHSTAHLFCLTTVPVKLRICPDFTWLRGCTRDIIFDACLEFDRYGDP